MDLEIKQNYVMVEPINMKNKQIGSILIVEDIEDRRVQRGKVIGIGDGKLPNDKNSPMNVKIGETILYGFNTGHITKMNHKEYVLLKEEEIIAVVEE